MSGPVAAKGRWPYLGHRTMAVVIADEERELALTVSCDHCGAGVGEFCISTRGNETWTPHHPRLRHARAVAAFAEEMA